MKELLSKGIICFSGLILALALFQHHLTPSHILLIVMGALLSRFDLKSKSYPLLLWLIPSLLLLLYHAFTPLCFFLCLLGIVAETYPLSIGSGDFFFLSSLALLLPLTSILWVVQIASLMGILIFLLTKRQASLPFVPCLHVAYLIVYSLPQLV